MKKKRTILILLGVIVALLCALLALCMPGCSAKPEQEPAAPAAEPTVAPAAAVEPAATIAPQAHVHVDAMVEETQAMLPVLSAGARALRESQTGFYDVADAKFVWSVLYHLCANETLDTPLAEVTEAGTVRIPYKLMQELASSCFMEYGDLPELPEDMESITYDEAWDAFIVKLSDAGDTRCVITDVAAGAAESSYMVAVAYLTRSGDKEELVDTYAFELRPNPYIDGINDPLYPLSVLGGYAACNVIARITAVEGDAEAPEITVEHVQIGWEVDEEDTEAHVMKISPVERPAETLKLRGMDAAELMAAGALLTGKPPELKDADAAFAWLKENYDRELDGERLVYQMRVYQGEIYSMAPMASLYFAG